jgi:hypothetical protein
MLTIGLALNLVTLSAIADLYFTAPNIPASSWEQFPQGIALAMTLENRTHNGAQKHYVMVYIKNTSGSDKYFYEMNDISRLELYYVTDSGTAVPLRTYNYDHRDGIVLMNVPPYAIKPGEVLSRDIELTSDELALVKSHAVKCSFFISDKESAKGYKIESSPRILTETVGPNREKKGTGMNGINLRPF